MMHDWKSTLAVMLVFALGCVAGLFVGFIVMQRQVTVALQRGSPAYEQMLERRLSRGLHLNDDQRERFHEALANNIAARQQLQRQLMPQVQQLNLVTRDEIRSILRPDQLALFRKNMADFRGRFGSPGLGRFDRTAGGTNDAMPIGATNDAPQAN
jgi:uncharacterized protein YneF (UPF0154 family)